jgi:hypothetical protein
MRVNGPAAGGGASDSRYLLFAEPNSGTTGTQELDQGNQAGATIDGTWTADDLEANMSAMEDGDGVLKRIRIESQPGGAPGVYQIWLGSGATFDGPPIILDQANAAQFPHAHTSYTANKAFVAISQDLGDAGTTIGDSPGELFDICTDSDGDSVIDSFDNCPTTVNADQANFDNDSQGDACDSDDDNDQVCDPSQTGPPCTGSDQCPFTALGASVDANGCAQVQVDSDVDGVCNPAAASTLCVGTDSCPGTTSGAVVDANGCSQVQVDSDLDGVCNSGTTSSLCTGSDACPGTASGAIVDANGCSQVQVDTDLDGVCDPSVTSTLCAGTDNCPLDSNPAQTNTDTTVNPPGDGLGDACDPDDDNDGFTDADEAASAGVPPDNLLASDPLNPASIPESCDGVDNDLNEGNNEGFPDNDADAQADCVDADDDNDGVPDALPDNCQFVANPVQDDFNADGEGDHCDDTDGDGVLDAFDNCPLAPDPDQTDSDGDGRANPCDSDDDNDTVLDIIDNCRTVVNPSQADYDADGVGDQCDDSDQDGIFDSSDNCLLVPNPGQGNYDVFSNPPGDALGDACDSDDDNDGVPDVTDNCYAAPNPGQEDSDQDGVGDACGDVDVDGDVNGLDNCPTVFNPDQQNIDGDSAGDVCDPDNMGQSVVSHPTTGDVTVSSPNVSFVGTTTTPGSTVTIVPNTSATGTIETGVLGTSLIAQTYDLLSPSLLSGTVTQTVTFSSGITQGQLANIVVTKELPGGPLILQHTVLNFVESGGFVVEATIEYLLIDDAAIVVSTPFDGDADGIVDLYDFNNDGDFGDSLERDNCPETVNPNQLNTDAAVTPPGDGLGDVCDLDDDNDGYTDFTESHVGTGSLLPCGGANWPADLVSDGISANRVDLQDIGSFLAPVVHLNTSPGDPGFDRRWDLIPGSAAGPGVSLQDIGNLIVLAPPMLGGLRAFNGPACPFVP